MKVKLILSIIVISLIFYSCVEVKDTHSEADNNIVFINSQSNIDSGYPFSEATIVNGIIYLSGEIGTLPDGNLISGGIIQETRQTLTNIKNKLVALGGINSSNFFRLKLTRSKGFASISWIKKNGLNKI